MNRKPKNKVWFLKGLVMSKCERVELVYMQYNISDIQAVPMFCAYYFRNGWPRYFLCE